MATIPQPLSFISFDYRYLAVNDAYADYFDCPTNLIIGKTVAELCGPSIFENEIKSRLDRCLGGEALRYEVQVEFPKKGWRWMEMSYTPCRNVDGSISGVISHGFDITDHKQMEKAIRESERKWRNILINTPQIGITLDPEANITFANKRFLELTGWREDEILNKNWFDLLIPKIGRAHV